MSSAFLPIMLNRMEFNNLPEVSLLFGTEAMIHVNCGLCLNFKAI